MNQKKMKKTSSKKQPSLKMLRSLTESTLTRGPAGSLFLNGRLIEFTVEESEWIRGREGAYSSLLTIYRKQRCCIGFLAKACGVSDKAMIGKPGIHSLYPAAFRKVTSKVPSAIGSTGVNDWLPRAYRTNDTSYISDEDRKDKLVQLLAKGDVLIKFTP